MWEKQTNYNWPSLREDPDNWLVIPKFNLPPKDVDYQGFKIPILGPNSWDFLIKLPIFDTVHIVRDEARKRFSSLALLQQNYEKAYESDAFIVDEPPNDWSEDMIFAVRYESYFYQLERCFVCLRHKKNESLVFLANASKLAVDLFSSKNIDAELIRSIRTEMAKKGAAAMLEKNVKQQQKQQVRACWEMWRNDPARYTGKAEFSRDMLDKYEDLRSHAVVQRWCREWEAAT